MSRPLLLLWGVWRKVLLSVGPGVPERDQQAVAADVVELGVLVLFDVGVAGLSGFAVTGRAYDVRLYREVERGCLVLRVGVRGCRDGYGRDAVPVAGRDAQRLSGVQGGRGVVVAVPVVPEGQVLGRGLGERDGQRGRAALVQSDLGLVDVQRALAAVVGAVGGVASGVLAVPDHVLGPDVD